MNTEPRATSQLHGFGRRLVAEGLMDEQAAIEASIDASKKGMTILAWLIKNNDLDPEALINAASVEYGVPVLDIKAIDLSLAPLSLVDEKLIEKHQAFPLYLRGNSLFLAVSDPTDKDVIDAISFSSGFRVEPILVAPNHLEAAIERAQHAAHPVFDDFEEEGLEDVGFQLDANDVDEDALDPAVDETPVARGQVH
jgi:type IV pilus assembly protein PilB